MNKIFANLPTTIFEVMSGLARQKGAINLGQGFPDDKGPLDVREKAAQATIEGDNQYPSMMGVPELRQAMADHYAEHQGIKVDPLTQTLVTSGATEAIAGALLATIEPGDEVILFQPMYDAYLPLVLRAGGVPKFVTLRPPRWRIEEDELAKAFTARTKALVFNNPLNPSARVYEREQVELVAKFCARHGVIAICDEVWEHLVYDGREHVSMLSVPGMEALCVKIGSAGKIFSLTGWKVGLTLASAELMKTLAKAHQFLTFTTPPNLQAAVAYGLRKDRRYFLDMRACYQAARDHFTAGLIERGFSVLPGEGAYFINVDIAPLGESDDVAFCTKLIETYGVAAIPVSAFYAQEPVRNVVRFCFAKNVATLDAALDRLRQAARG